MMTDTMRGNVMLLMQSCQYTRATQEEFEERLNRLTSKLTPKEVHVITSLYQLTMDTRRAALAMDWYIERTLSEDEVVSNSNLQRMLTAYFGYSYRVRR